MVMVWWMLREVLVVVDVDRGYGDRDGGGDGVVDVEGGGGGC